MPESRRHRGGERKERRDEVGAAGSSKSGMPILWHTGVYAGVFCEVIVNARFILARVEKIWKEREAGAENKRLTRPPFVCFCEISEVAVNKRVRGILGWAGVWDDAVRLTEGVVANTNQSYHRSYVPVKQNRRFRSERVGRGLRIRVTACSNCSQPGPRTKKFWRTLHP